jgi:predicted alpha-1,2-mannosidase
VMVGDPATIVLADTYLRGIKDFEVDKAYEAMYKSATVTELEGNKIRPGLSYYINKGYIPDDGPKLWGSVSTTLEYCIADYTVSQMAKEIGKTNDYKLFYNRSLNYKNVFDPSLLFVRPRLDNGKWAENFNPIADFVKIFPGRQGFVEGASWNYTFMVPHDMTGLKKMFGDKLFVERLEQAFDSNYFMMENEPDIAYPYLFNYVKGSEWKTQKYVHQCMRKYFKNDINGLPGDDDCGTMSAWMAYSMMGFYPDCPANLNYQLSSPVFDKVTIHLNNKYYKGDNFVITTTKPSDSAIFIDKISINQKEIDRFYIHHNEITTGGAIHFELRATPSNK